LSAYCAGAITPAATCAAATGGVCNISKVYDQTGNGNAWTQTTAASQPTLTFSAINSLPVITCASSQTINTTATFTTTIFSEATVYKRTSGTALGGAFGGNAAGFIGSGSVANDAVMQNGSTANVSGATDNAWHGLNGTLTSGSQALNVDGTDNTGLSAGSSNLSSSTLRFCRAGANELLGEIAEGGLWPATSFTSTQRGNLFTNMNSSSGYNGAL
jgi:hypothetical protein